MNTMPMNVTDAPLAPRSDTMSECGHVGPFAWVDNRGSLRPIRCNRPRHWNGDHAHSTKRTARKYTWTDSDLTVHTTSLKGPWETVRRIH